MSIDSTINPISYRADLIRNAALIIWDELPATNVAAMECVNNICSAIMKNDAPFGGIHFVGAGDFRQIAPVTTGIGPIPARQASILSSTLWPSFKVVSLYQPYRSAQDLDYTAFVDQIGEDFENQEVLLDMLDVIETLPEAIDFLFPPAVIQDPRKCLTRAFLSPLNRTVDEFNKKMLDRLIGEECKQLCMTP